MRTQQRIVASRETGNFEYGGEIRWCATCVITRGVLSIHISIQALTGASREIESESAPRSIVQTGDILNTERNAARVLFCEIEWAVTWRGLDE